MTLRESLVKHFGLTERTGAYTDRPHADLWSGSGVSPSISDSDEGAMRVRKLLSAREWRFTIDEPEAWADWPYRVVWRVPSERLHITFCEGDVSVLEARSDDDFTAIDASADNFYGKRDE